MPDGPASTALRISARVRPSPASLNAFSKVAIKPDAPDKTARSGLITGSGRKCWLSRASLGINPARKNDDLPAPEAPRITNNRGGGLSLSPRSRSRPITVGPSRPKKDSGVLGVEGLHAAIWRPIRVVIRGPRKVAGIKSRLH